jgi:hypothetical protein
VKKRWAIAAYRVGQMVGHDYINSSIGLPYRELKAIARKMNRNGEGQRYAVVEARPQNEIKLPK